MAWLAWLSLSKCLRVLAFLSCFVSTSWITTEPRLIAFSEPRARNPNGFEKEEKEENIVIKITLVSDDYFQMSSYVHECDWN